ncbi:relaxase/mobilization nuclease domain-containing protein [Alistipes putredinis]|uniref:relaxase/mobilization nuclease domain-containing protein n=1 Tax=Alistipes putredinis TaxID=28117 RepID=UPI003AB1F149
MDSFRPYLEANRRTTNTVFHVSLNPSPEDRLTDGQLRDIAQEYMERMGYGEQHGQGCRCRDRAGPACGR